MKGLTERQIRRREDILSAARKLLTKQGVDGVTMRRLAKESGVAPKTLYHQFGSKEKLLRTAVQERFRYYYRMIDEEEVAHGIDRLYFIVDKASATTQKNLEYAKAMTSLVQDDPDDAFNAIRLQTYRKAVDQMREEEAFLPWVNVDLVSAIVFRQLSPNALNFWLADSSWGLVPKFLKLEVSMTLQAVTHGYTQKRAAATIKAMQKSLKGYSKKWS